MDWIKLAERREAGQRQIIIGSEYIKNQPASNTPRTSIYNFLTQIYNYILSSIQSGLLALVFLND